MDFFIEDSEFILGGIVISADLTLHFKGEPGAFTLEGIAVSEIVSLDLGIGRIYDAPAELYPLMRLWASQNEPRITQAWEDARAYDEGYLADEAADYARDLANEVG